MTCGGPDRGPTAGPRRSVRGSSFSGSNSACYLAYIVSTMKVLDRYLIRETIAPFLLALAVYTFVLAVDPMLSQAQLLLSKGVPIPTVAFMLITLLPQALGVTIPMAFLTGLLIALGRMSGDRESVALLACGVSPLRLLRPVLMPGRRRRPRRPVHDGQGRARRQSGLRPGPLETAQRTERDRHQAAGVLRAVPGHGPVRRTTTSPAAAGTASCWRRRRRPDGPR